MPTFAKVLVIVTLFVFAGGGATPLDAQWAQPAAAGPALATDGQLQSISLSGTALTDGRASQWGRYAKWGAVIGAVTMASLVAIEVAFTEDPSGNRSAAMALMYVVPLGALGGAVIGGIVGAIKD